MGLEHGSLESIILNSIWKLEEEGNSESSVNQVFEKINLSGEQRAYTTVKTVMDRLFDKGVLSRFKLGKKFFYKSAYSKDQMVKMALEKIARQYFDSDLGLLISHVQIESSREAAMV